MIVQTSFKPEQYYASISACVRKNEYDKTLDIVQNALITFPHHAILFLSLAYDIFSSLPDQSRYGLYQHRFFDFAIKSTDKVLDIGLGHIPFPFATVLLVRWHFIQAQYGTWVALKKALYAALKK